MLVPSLWIPAENRQDIFRQIISQSMEDRRTEARRYWGLVMINYPDLPFLSERTPDALQIPKQYWCLERTECKGRYGMWEDFRPDVDEDPYIFKTFPFAESRLEILQKFDLTRTLDLAIWVHPDYSASPLLNDPMLQSLCVRSQLK